MGKKTISRVRGKKPSEQVKKLVTRNKKLNDLLKIIERGKRMWESTFDAIMSPVHIVSRDYSVLRANLSFAAMCGEDIRDVIGQKCYVIFANRAEPCLSCPLKQSFLSSSHYTSHLDNLIAKREFDASAYPIDAAIHDSSVVYYHDITEERRLQRELIQQEKMAAIGMLAGGVAHEINNPLGGIIAFVQLLKRDSANKENLKNDLEEIERAALRCKKIVADLLDFSRVSSDRDRCLVNVNTLIEKVFPFIQREIKSFNVELKFDAGLKIPSVLGIPDRLQQVFLNLLTNACHAMPKGGTLIVRTRSAERGKFVDISVRDTGTGIPCEIIDKIFDPFFTTKEPGKGTGLGLSISYRIVKDHDGDIFCNALSGGGTEFVVRLPAKTL